MQSLRYYSQICNIYYNKQYTFPDVYLESRVAPDMDEYLDPCSFCYYKKKQYTIATAIYINMICWWLVNRTRFPAITTVGQQIKHRKQWFGYVDQLNKKRLDCTIDLFMQNSKTNTAISVISHWIANSLKQFWQFGSRCGKSPIIIMGDFNALGYKMG